MSRSVAWRHTASDTASWRQDQALNSTIYLLRTTGPTSFLLKEDGESKKFKVFLGDPHRCSCSAFMKEKDLCKHICWVLLRKFRVPRQNPVTWQLGLVEREINEILRGGASKEQRPGPNARHLARMASNNAPGQNNEEGDKSDDGSLAQREITEEDVCPICQDELLAKHQPVTYCRFGCGNNVHIKCMKVWAEHQRSTGETEVKCPICREKFGAFSLLQEEFRNSSLTRAERFNEHLGVACKKCNACPIVGKCYKCATCVTYHLCQACFNTPTHMDHAFEFKSKPSQRWRPAPQRGDTHILPQAVVQNLMTRDISEEDYDLLLQLDSQATQQLSDLTEETVQSFPKERVRHNGSLLAPGTQCRVCLRGYKEGEFVRRLPCRHKFHKDCIDNWLLHRHATCPIDGTVYTNESVRLMRDAQRNNNTSLRLLRERREQESSAQGSRTHGSGSTVVGSDALDLQIPGVGIARQPHSSSRSQPASGRQLRGSLRSQHRAADASLPNFNVSGINVAQNWTEDILTAVARHNNPNAFRGTMEPSELTDHLSEEQHDRAPAAVFSPLAAGERSIELSLGEAHQPSRGNSSAGSTGSIRSGIRQRAAHSDLHSTDGDMNFTDLIVGNPHHTHVESDPLQNSANVRQPREGLVTEPVAPSIPLLRAGASLGLDLEGRNGLGSASHKPPSGQGNTAQGRQGRLRSKPLYRDPGSRQAHSANRDRSNSRGRQDSTTSAANLFVGHDPATAAAFTSEFLNTSPHGNGRRAQGSVRTSNGSDPRYRWGCSDNPTEDITLSGSALSGLSVKDLIS